MAEQAVAPTEQDLMVQMQKALEGGDFRAVAKVAGELAKFQKSKEELEQAARLAALGAVTSKVNSAIQNAVDKLVKAGDLDAADGIWFSWDFGDVNQPICQLTKGKPKAARTGTSGGGGGKRFSIRSEEMLEKHGSELCEFKGSKGEVLFSGTLQEAWDFDKDKNWRAGKVRTALLKLEGLI